MEVNPQHCSTMITNALTKLQKIFPSQFKNVYTEALNASTKIPLKGKVKKNSLPNLEKATMLPFQICKYV